MNYPAPTEVARTARAQGEREIRNALTIDVEEHFQVAAFEREIGRDSWARYASRVAANTRRAMDLFAARGVKATFFVLGWVADRDQQLIREIVRQGHELGSHGYDHRRLHGMSPAEVREDVTRTKRILEDVSGTEVKGYRAPSYSIGRDNLWVLDILQETGYRYSSSIYPIRHDLYGMPEAPRFPFRYRAGAILEIPITTMMFAGRKLPCGGGGYFRLLPYPIFRWALRRVNAKDEQPGIFYFHPWELDPSQPRVHGISLRSRFRHYTNLASVEGRLDRLLVDFAWGRMDDVFHIA